VNNGVSFIYDYAMGVVEDLDELGKLGRGVSSMDDLEKVDIGDESFLGIHM
jgi:hypothetical protein